jgi:hypothetical protein
LTDLDSVLDSIDFAEGTPEKPRGPWCGACCHDYSLEGFVSHACPYCGVAGAVAAQKPFVEMSKSSIELWERCNRRWYFKYILKHPEPKNRFAAWGIAAHEVSEGYLAGGALPAVNDLDPKSQESKIARSLLGGLPHIPRPDHPGLKVEAEFHFDFEGVRYGGFKDYEAPVAWPLIPTCEALVGDHKFTGNLQYALTEYELAHDKQGIIYAWDIMRGRYAWRRVWLNWVYMTRGEAVARPVRVAVDRDSVIAGMRKLNVIGRHLTQLRARHDLAAKDFPPNENACYDFKEPCPHMDLCDQCGDRNINNQIAHAS